MAEDKIRFHVVQPPFLREPDHESSNFYGPPPHCCWQSFTMSLEEEHMYLAENKFTNLTEEGYVTTFSRLVEKLPSARLQQSLDSVFNIIEEEQGPMGVIGFSEGASIGVSLMIEEQRRQREDEEYKPRIKCAILCSGTLPLQVISDRVRLVVDTPETIKAPTLHVLSATDPFSTGNIVVYRLFDPETADILDNGTGHIIPRDNGVLEEIRAWILELGSALEADSQNVNSS
ncbi:hypothetical protein N7467_011857 [Penicillium canescens]|nr:hypothetical protein N7467_011857 [Penicillium canescens]